MHRLQASNLVPALLLAALCCACVGSSPRTAVLGAFDAETTWLIDQLEEPSDVEVLGMTFTIGRLGGREVVVGLTGVGKVNAGMTTALLIDRFKPEAVIFTGVAGGLNPDLLPGDIVIGARTVQHDLGQITPDGNEPFGVRNPANGVRNPVFFEADPGLLERAEDAARSIELEKINTAAGERIPRIVMGVIITGDSFITSTPKKSALRQRFEADAVEMEGAAVAQICLQQGIPCLVIRALSDKSDESAQEDFERFFEVAARNANRIVLLTLTGVPEK